MSTDEGKFCLHGLLPPVYYRLFCQVVDIFKHLLAKQINIARYASFYPQLIKTLCRFEQFVPATNHLMVVHLLMEIYQDVNYLGPSYYYWMYMFGM